jgi:hypothetical protein
MGGGGGDGAAGADGPTFPPRRWKSASGETMAAAGAPMAHRHSKASSNLSARELRREERERERERHTWRNANEDNLVIINVSGRRFELPANILRNCASPRLRELAPTETCVHYMPTRSRLNRQDEYYFFRDPTMFEQIVSYLSGERKLLHLPTHVCVDQFDDEMAFFGLAPDDEGHGGAHACNSCNFELTEADDHPVTLMNAADREAHKLEIHRLIASTENADQHTTGTSVHTGAQIKACFAKVWAVVEGEGWLPGHKYYTASIRAAAVFTLISMATLLASICTLIVETLPAFREEVGYKCADGNGTGCLPQGIGVDFTEQNCQIAGCDWSEEMVEVAHRGLYLAESLFIGWFTFELVLRFVVCPSKAKFCKDVLNLVDVVAIVPFYLGLAVESAGSGFTGLRTSRCIYICI